MEFWGAEVKAGEPLKVEPIDGKILHLSQACLGETKKGVDHGVIYVKVGDQKLVLGSLSSEKIPQLSFDLVFEKEFELSHNLKSGSVHFCGYQTFIGDVATADDSPDGFASEDEGSDDSEFDSDEGEDFPLNITENGIAGQKVAEAKPSAAKTIAAKPESSEKQKVKIQEPSEDESDDESDDSDEGDSDDESDEGMLEADSDEDEGSDDDDEETPTPKKLSKKRPNESASKTPVPTKKAKQVTPQKTDGKKGVHTATPHPAKKVAKTPATGDKPKPQTPKSGGSEHSCKSCTKSFGSDGALQSHNKAKHNAAK